MRRIANLERWSTGKFLLLILILGCAKAPAEQPESSPSIEEGSLYTCIADDLNQGKPLVITVYVALCDWKHQGVIGVDHSPIADGDDPATNLYWGGWEGFRGYFEHKDTSWELVRVLPQGDTILESAVFKKTFAPNDRWKDLFGVTDSFDVYLVGLAYRGKFINAALRDFFNAALTDSALFFPLSDSTTIEAAGASRIVGYMGHNGFMEAYMDTVKFPANSGTHQKGVFALACMSKYIFEPPLSQSNLTRLAFTIQLMGPFAYVTAGLAESVTLCETREERLTRMARAYDKYQKCGVKAARGLFE